VNLRDRLARPGAVMLDGATGTELQRRGVDTTLPLWSARALTTGTGRGVLAAIHQEYAAAGAEVLTTNTFRTTPRALGRAGLLPRWALLNRRAVESARAGGGPGALVAGSLAPLEDCYEPQSVPPQETCLREHLQQADLLARLGVDLLLVETMNCRREARAALLAARSTGLDILLALCPGEPDRLLSGEPLADALPRLLDDGGGRVLGVLLNCAPPEVLERAAPLLDRLLGSLPWGLSAHLGRPDPQDGWRLPEEHAPEAYAEWAAARVRDGARLASGCCGTTPAHIERLAARLRDRPTRPGSAPGAGPARAGARPRTAEGS
jgi:S-methylmethionine-dependent homocysteine/selenocysteine methylase